jgi:photosystem II stability/assembly factor-like uncharacterized protein
MLKLGLMILLRHTSILNFKSMEKSISLYFQSIPILLPSICFAQWTMTTSTGFNQYVFFINDSVGYSGNNNFSNVSFDGGFTWQADTSIYANFKNAVFADSIHGFAISDNALYQTGDAGITWSNISDSVEITDFYNLAVKSGHVIINGYKDQVGFYWYVSVNNGQTWEMRNFHATRNPLISHILDENHFFFADSYNGIA